MNETATMERPYCLKKKIPRKYKIKAEKRMHKVFIHSKFKNRVYHDLQLDDGLESCLSSNENIATMPEQHSMDINDEVSDCNLQYSSDNSDTYENIYCNKLESSSVISVFHNKAEKKSYVLKGLRDWGLRNISKRKVDQILKLLKLILPFLPKSHKTLLRTPRSVPVQVIGTGYMWYKGIRLNIEQRIQHQCFVNNKQIVIDVNIDGIPIQNDFEKQFWPILGRFVNDKYPFIIGVFYGRGKPNDLEAFLDNYIAEIAELTENGVEYKGTIYPFYVRHYILDAQARSFVKKCVLHNSRYACEKCIVRGEWFRNRIIFEDINCEMRTDDSFRMRQNASHRTGNSPLERLNTGMVSQFRLDPLHLIYLGVFKRFLSFLIEKRTQCRLQRDIITRINENLSDVSQHFAKEFNRKPRSLGNRDSRTKWKGTEFRRCLLYDGIQIFKDHLPEKIYNTFLLLHCAIYILSSPTLYYDLNSIADYLLKTFIRYAARHLGRNFLVYNVHSALHLAEECNNFVPLESFSAFPYENYLGVIKRTLKSNYKPLQQLAKRDLETGGILTEDILSNSGRPMLRGLHEILPEMIEGKQYTEVIWQGFTFSSNHPNNCFVTQFGEIVILTNIINAVHGVVVVGRKYLQLHDFYTFPLPSSVIGIYKVKEKERRHRYWKASHIKAKCVTIPLGDGMLCIPMIGPDY